MPDPNKLAEIEDVMGIASDGNDTDYIDTTPPEEGDGVGNSAADESDDDVNILMGLEEPLPDGDDNKSDGEPDPDEGLPDKLKGKSREEIVEIYQEAEKFNSRLSTDLADLKKTVASLTAEKAKSEQIRFDENDMGDSESLLGKMNQLAELIQNPAPEEKGQAESVEMSEEEVASLNQRFDNYFTKDLGLNEGETSEIRRVMNDPATFRDPEKVFKMFSAISGKGRTSERTRRSATRTPANGGSINGVPSTKAEIRQYVNEHGETAFRELAGRQSPKVREKLEDAFLVLYPY